MGSTASGPEISCHLRSLMDLAVGSIGLTGEVDVGPVRGEGKLGNMSRRMMKKLCSAHWKRAVWAGVLEVGAKDERCGELATAFASKPAPTFDLCRSQNLCTTPI
ncbi:hypothetical protein EAH78_22530 [Pseudomonas arsenicoxydans]|uniref:Uncharacterized protein n=1 Tax=Pseudomonas arsenicoxydans TaxID=702115 RepID=A0A502HJP0_9PSED|nr:hypothetical protein EAH78_22530 [Pseudomonas arsenicoxydans]